LIDSTRIEKNNNNTQRMSREHLIIVPDSQKH
jgi:hypothetical protein